MEKISFPEDTYLVGIGVSPGIAIGEAFLVDRGSQRVVERAIPEEAVASEQARFRAALESSRTQLESIRAKVGGGLLREQLFILDAHILILRDPMFVATTERLIRSELLCAESALKRALETFRAFFDNIEDEYLRERRSDIDAVGQRVLRNLAGAEENTLERIDRRALIVAHDLSPADTLQMDRNRIIGFVTDVGGRTSHTAILARSLGIPAVVGLESATLQIPHGLPLIIDGAAGTVILNPSEETCRDYLARRQAAAARKEELQDYRDKPCETPDGVRVTLQGNLELLEDAEQARRTGAEGIGLFRTEFLYLGRELPPSEEEQVALYRSIIESAAPHPVTIRTLDLGGDKFAPEIDLQDEDNPALGLRGIRFSLKEVTLFKAQLRAILRAALAGPVRVMFPMISGIDEVRHCRALFVEALAELEADGIPHAPGLLLGVMIETPAAALIADLLAGEVDFFSVGTNDLIQYCLAVDRGNEHVAHLYDPLHPAILRVLSRVCASARAAGIEVGVCGEMASEPLFVPVLIGLGFRQLSMSSSSLLKIKRLVRHIPHRDCVALADKLLSLPTAAEIGRCLEEEFAGRYPELLGEDRI